MDLSRYLYNVVLTPDFDVKIDMAKKLTTLESERLAPLPANQSVFLKMPGRPDSHRVVPPRLVPKRNFRDEQSRKHFLHAIANIELLAIELPALCLLRFGSEDEAFVATQLKIIAEEAYHFELLRERLGEMGCEFGSIPVHHGLWEWAWRCESELEHQILIPCYLEARGLDVTPEFIREFQKLGDQKTARILSLILDEEVLHVRHGLTYLSKRAEERDQSTNDMFEAVLRRFFGDKLRSKVPLNPQMRTLAGFSREQIALLAS
jgi:uncharacterized ferritin-like protein (DUF455 family)